MTRFKYVQQRRRAISKSACRAFNAKVKINKERVIFSNFKI